MGDILLFNCFFPIVDMCISYEDIARQSCAMVPIWRIFGDFLDPAFPASCVQHISGTCILNSHKGHTMLDIQSATAEVRRGKKEEEEERKKERK